MKKYLTIIAFTLATFGIAKAQEYKIAKTGGKMTLDLSAVIVEGYNGNEVVFSSTRDESEADPRAKGLRAISGSGYTDNTGLGISVTENGSDLEVHQVASSIAVKIKVPKNVIVSLTCHKMPNAGTIEFKDLTNEIEISTDYNHISLDNVTGPMTVRALYGQVEARFSAPIKGPIAIASVYSTVDVAIPTDTKADVRLNTSHGDILAAAALNIVLEKNMSGDMVRYGNVVNGKINGGGTDFKLTSEYGKIYLRTIK